METVKASDVVQAYLEGGPSEVFDVVRVQRDGSRAKMQVRIRLLRSEENIEALKAAQKTARDFGEAEPYGDIYKEAQAHEVLARCVCATEEHPLTGPEAKPGAVYYPPLCVNAAHLRKCFNETELAVFLNCYHIVKSKYGAIELLEKGDAETWITRMSDPLRGPFYLSHLDSLHWPGLIVLLATVSRDLCQAAGLELPSLETSTESTPDASTSDTGSSTEPPSVSSTADPELKVPAGTLLTKETAAEIVRKRGR